MKLIYKITENDYIAFNRSHFQRSAYLKRNFTRLRIYMTVILFVIPILVSMMITSDFSYLWVGAAAGAVIALLSYLLYPKYYWHTVTKSLRKALRGGRNMPPWTSTAELYADDDGVHFSIGGSDSLCAYNDYSGTAEDGGYTYMYFGKGQGVVIPPDVDGTDEFLKEFEERLK